jgi:hypothetical protein
MTDAELLALCRDIVATIGGEEAPEGPPAIGHDAEGPPTGRRRVRDAGETQIAPPGFSFNGGEDHGPQR